MVQGVTDNPTIIPSPNPSLAVLNADIASLDTAETAAKTRAKGAAADRNEKLAVVVSDVGLLRACVQKLVDANPENAASIAAAAGMSLKKAATRTKSDLTAKPSKTTSGTVSLVAKAAAKKASYQWEVSLDGGKTYTALPDTLKAKTSIANLTPGAVVSFRQRALTPAGSGNWSQVVSVMVV